MRLPKNIPKLIGHKNKPLRLVFIGCNLPKRYDSHPRLKVFCLKGTKCAHPGCNRKGFYLIQTEDPGGGRHLDLYTKDFHLMTIDHIYPKSKGGSSHIDNLQPMCEKHNQLKKDTIIQPNKPTINEGITKNPEEPLDVQDISTSNDST